MLIVSKRDLLMSKRDLLMCHYLTPEQEFQQVSNAMARTRFIVCRSFGLKFRKKHVTAASEEEEEEEEEPTAHLKLSPPHA